MKIFLGWSGEASRRCALLLRDWLQDVLQSLEVFMSEEDLRKGSRWPDELASELQETNFGILCVTASNLDSTWMHFEAGALSKSLTQGRVSPFLLGVDAQDVKPPLGHFEATKAIKEDVRRLVRDINAQAEQPLAEGRLDRAFERLWPELEASLSDLAAAEMGDEGEPPRRPDREVLGEILETLRAYGRDVGMIGVRARPGPPGDQSNRVWELAKGELEAASKGLVTVFESQKGRWYLQVNQPLDGLVLSALTRVADRYRIALRFHPVNVTMSHGSDADFDPDDEFEWRPLDDSP